MIAKQLQWVVAATVLLVAGFSLASDELAVTRFLSKDGTPLAAGWHADQKTPTFVVIHGFRARGTDPAFVSQANAMQSRFSKANVVIVDWTVPAKRELSSQTSDEVTPSGLWNGLCDASDEYDRAVHATRAVGRDIAEWMKRQGVDPAKTVLCGHSLGAQIAGFASKCLGRPEILGRKVHTILAADPAGPSFSGMPAACRLDETDAQEVIVVHTTDFFGDNREIGSFDVYVSWPRSDTTDLVSRHSFATELVTRSFVNPGLVTEGGLPFAANAIGRHCRSDVRQTLVVSGAHSKIAAR